MPTQRAKIRSKNVIQGSCTIFLKDLNIFLMKHSSSDEKISKGIWNLAFELMLICETPVAIFLHYYSHYDT